MNNADGESATFFSSSWTSTLEESSSVDAGRRREAAVGQPGPSAGPGAPEPGPSGQTVWLRHDIRFPDMYLIIESPDWFSLKVKLHVTSGTPYQHKAQHCNKNNWICRFYTVFFYWTVCGFIVASQTEKRSCIFKWNPLFNSLFLLQRQ